MRLPQELMAGWLVSVGNAGGWPGLPGHSQGSLYLVVCVLQGVKEMSRVSLQGWHWGKTLVVANFCVTNK